MFHYHQKHMLGFSLLELLVSISFIAIIASFAVPSFSRFIAKTQLITQTNLLLNTLYSARSYAISHQVIILICQRNADNTCNEKLSANVNWEHGWMLFADYDGDDHFDENEIIQVVANSSATNILFNQNGRLRFSPSGSARSAGFYLCSKDGEYTRHIYILYTGRTRVNDQLSNTQKQLCKTA